MKELAHYIEEEHEIIATLSQTGTQYDNPSVTLYRIIDEDNANNLPIGAIAYQEYTGSETNTYALEGEEVTTATADPAQYLINCAHDWAWNLDEENELECIRWGITQPEELVVPDDYAGECRIISVGCYYGYSPVRYVEETDDMGRSSVKTFPNRTAAQDWIDEQSEEVYRLDHNEADRPTYYIVED